MMLTLYYYANTWYSNVDTAFMEHPMTTTTSSQATHRVLSDDRELPLAGVTYRTASLTAGRWTVSPAKTKVQERWVDGKEELLQSWQPSFGSAKGWAF